MTDSTMVMSDLPQDLVDKVVSRVPVTSLKALRTTCKKWKTLFKYRRFAKKHIRKSRAATKKKEFMAIMMMDSTLYLMSVGIHNDYDEGNNVESFINRKAKLISLNDAARVDMSSVFHCNGLLLCRTKVEKPSLVVFNPYSGQTRWIETTYRDDIATKYSFALGYEEKNSHRSLKILTSMEVIMRFIDKGYSGESRSFTFEIYHFNSDSWKDIALTSNERTLFHKRGLSLNGNTYWLAKKHTNWSDRRDGSCRCHCFRRFQRPVREIDEFFLLCFDFTAERFGPRLSLPFQCYDGNTVTLSSVRYEQLAVLFQRKDTLQMEIWITTKIEPQEASWSKLFLAVDMTTLLTYD